MRGSRRYPTPRGKGSCRGPDKLQTLIGERGSIGAPPTIVHAVLDALAPFDIDNLDVPGSADISTNARRPWRVISIGLQRAYRRNASNSRRNFKIVIMAMTIVRYFDRFSCLLRVGDVALCRYSIKSLDLSAAKFLSRNTRSAATFHLSQSTTSVRSA